MKWMRIHQYWANKLACYHKDNRTSKKDTQVGQHFVECRGATNDIEWNFLNSCRTAEKLMIIEAIYISKLKPALNTRDKYRGRKLTLNY